jgi:acyl-CoA oxidase
MLMISDSNVRGIETEARWDQETKEFVIHSPTLTAAKWWNGSLGRTANHAIVVAQLLLPSPSPSSPQKYTSYGPHQFIVQVRDLQTNKPLEGIVIGDIGPKYGYTSMDNGYMLFHQFHVPHSALMSKYSGVNTLTGAYLPPKNQALSYGSMTFVRSQIVMGARMALARAATISIRYTAIRLQFADKDAAPGAREEPVLNYPTVQIRLLPLLATTYALHYTGEAMFNLYWDTRAEIESTGQSSQLAEMHAASSGLKSLCTTLAADGIEVCRRALGGHGYGGGSGFISLNNEYLDKPTVEGDNWMITQQTASYLLKRMTEAVSNPTASTTTPIDVQFRRFLTNRKANTTSFDVYTNDGDIVAAFQHRTSHLVYQAYQARIERKESWTSLMLQLHRMSIAFAESLLVSNFYAAVFENAPVPALDSTSHSVLKQNFRLYSLFTMEVHAAEFLLSGSLQAAHLGSLTKKIQNLLAEIRPHAVRLVDAWSIPDYVLNSSLGRSDGNVYNDLFRKAHLENPLNMVTFNPDWKTEEIVMGEGAEVSRRRIEALVRGVEGHEQAGTVKSRL